MSETHSKPTNSIFDIPSAGVIVFDSNLYIREFTEISTELPLGTFAKLKYPKVLVRTVLWVPAPSVILTKAFLRPLPTGVTTRPERVTDPNGVGVTVGVRLGTGVGVGVERAQAAHTRGAISRENRRSEPVSTLARSLTFRIQVPLGSCPSNADSGPSGA